MEEGLTGIFQQKSPPFLQLNPREKCLHLCYFLFDIFVISFITSMDIS